MASKISQCFFESVRYQGNSWLPIVVDMLFPLLLTSYYLIGTYFATLFFAAKCTAFSISGYVAHRHKLPDK